MQNTKMELVDRRMPGHISLATRFCVGLVASASLVGVPLAAVAADSEKPAQVAKRVEGGDKPHKLAPVLKLARQSHEALAQVKDYEAVFTKQELVGRQMVSHKMLLKVRTEPFSVYLRYLAPYEGREVIYVEGQNKGQLLAHDVGVKALVGTVSLLPTSRRAMDESRYPITKIGMQALLDLTIEQWESELAHDEIDVKYFPNAKIGEVECKVIQTSHSEPRKHFRFHMTRLYIDRSTNLPVRIEQFGWPAKDGDNPPIIEEYTYLNLKANVGLKDIDFDTRNPTYGY